MFWVLILYFLSAINLILRKSILAWSQPIFFQGVRLTLAGALLLTYLYLFRPGVLYLKRKDIWIFFQVALFFSYLSYLLSVTTLDDLSSARFAFMFNLSPFITAIIAYFYLSQKLSKMEIMSLCLGFIGFLPLVFVGKNAYIASVSFFSIPGLQLFISTASYAYGWILVSQLVNKRGYEPLLVIGIAFFSGGIAVLGTSFLFENWFALMPVSDIARFGTYLLAIVLISEIVVSNVYATLLKSYSVTFLSFAGFLYPLFSALLGWFIFGEGITYNFFISAAIVTLALYMFYRAEQHRKKKNMVEIQS